MRFAWLVLLIAAALVAQSPLTPGIKDFVYTDAPVIALEHARIIDGTGAPPRDDQTIVIAGGRIAALGRSAEVTIPANAHRIDLSGQTVIPGLVGMHEHLFYPATRHVPMYIDQPFSFPRLYLASGVTTARTAGTLEPYTDLEIRRMIDERKMPGPKMYITVGYLEGKGSWAPQMHELSGPDDARRFVEYWTAEGADSFKAYMHITRAELEAAITAAHAHGLKVAGHLCAVSFHEAAAMGIDSLEHGIVVDSDLVAGKKPDVCPDAQVDLALATLDMNGPEVQKIVADLVDHHVAVDSTLAVLEDAPPLQQRFVEALSPARLLDYLTARAELSPKRLHWSEMHVKKEVAFERAFVKAGGLLMAGADPTGNGSALAGFADQRNIELLVEGGFPPEEAIQIATLNGAKFLGLADEIGSVAAGKQADLAVIDGNPAARIADIEKVRIVFRDGIGYDSAKLIESVKGHVGVD